MGVLQTSTKWQLDNASPGNYTQNMPGNFAGGKDVLVVAVSYHGGSNTWASGSKIGSVTVGGVAVSTPDYRYSDAADANHITFWLARSVPSGRSDVVFNVTSSATNYYTAAAIEMDDLDAVSPIDATGNTGGNVVGTSIPIPITTVAAATRVVAGFFDVVGVDFTSITNPAGATTAFQDSAGNLHMSGAAARKDESSAGAKTYIFTVGTSNTFRGAAISLKLNSASPPTIDVQPTDQSATDGGTATFNTTTTGATSFQWERQAPTGGAWSNATGTSNVEDYTTPALSRATDAGARYRLKATNANGTTTSNEVGLTVTKQPTGPDFTNNVGVGYVGVLKVGGGLEGGGGAAAQTESVAANTTQSATVVRADSVTEPASAIDAQTAGGSAIPANLTEPATAGDTSAALRSTPAATSEPATAGDTGAPTLSTPAAATEALVAQATLSNANNDYQLDGSGTSPQTVTITSLNGKNVLLCVLGDSTQQSTPTDNKSNSYSGALLHEQGYAGGLWAPYDMRVYGLAAANGGSSHTFTVTKTDPARESSLIAVATTGDIIRQASVVARAAAGSGGQDYVSASVTLTNPGVLIAFWSGDGGLALASLAAAPKTGTGWTMPIGVFLAGVAYIQHAMAWKQVPAGTYTITWTHVDNQGAILSLIGVESSSGGAVEVVSAARTALDSVTEPATAAAAHPATLATSAAAAEPAAAADAPAAQAATSASAAEAAAAAAAHPATLQTSAATTEPASAGATHDGASSGGTQSVVESAAASDSPAAALATAAVQTEPAGAADAPGATLGTAAAVSEPVGAGDLAAAALSTLAAAVEAAAALDAPSAVALIVAALAEPASAAATHDGTAVAPNGASVTEPVTPADAPAATASTSASATEAASAAATHAAGQVQGATQSDAAAAADAQSAARTQSDAVTEPATAGATHAALSAATAAAQEAVNAQETLAVVLATLATIIEAASATDVVITGNFFPVSVTEPATAADFVAWVREAKAGDPRVLTIEAESRTLIISAEDRTVTIQAEDRRIIIAAEQRSTPTTGA